MSLYITPCIFKNLIEEYPTWEKLEAFLESEEGGWFRIIDRKNDLCLIRHEKGITRQDLPHSPWFRSVVWNRVTHRPVSIGPPKAAHTEFPYTTLQEVRDAVVICEEWLDGVMIHCFKQAGDSTMHISTRSHLDASGTFYSSKTFRQLFLESFTGSISDPVGQEIATFCSFLLQHKEHRNITPITQNRVVLIHQGVIHPDGSVFIQDGIEDEKRISLTEDADVTSWVRAYMESTTWTTRGLVWKDSLGNRWKMESEKYARVASLRGNHPTLLQRFAHLYTRHLVQPYLEYYPEDSFECDIHSSFIGKIIRILYRHYIELHITKAIRQEEIDKMYHPHLYALHGIYLSSLRSSGRILTITDIHIYLHKQPWQRIAFLLRRHEQDYFDDIREAIQQE